MSGSSVLSSLSIVRSLKKSFSILAFSVSVTYTVPSFSSGRIVELGFGEIYDFKIDHHCFEDRSLDFSFSARLSLSAFSDSRMAAVILFQICLNLFQSNKSCVLFALR